MKRQTLLRAVLLALLLVAGGCLGYWWYHTSRPGYRFGQGRQAIVEHRWGEAEAAANDLEGRGYLDHARLLRGESLYRRGRPEAALKELSQVRGGEELELRAAELAGYAAYALGDVRAAEGLLAGVVARRPDLADPYRILGAIAFDQGRLTEALGHLERLATLDPRDGRAPRLAGLIHKDLGHLPQAVEAYEEALRRELPEKVQLDVRTELAQVLNKRNRFEDVLCLLDPVPRDSALPPAASAARAAALKGLGRTEDARMVLDAALEHHPGDAELLRVRGQLERETGDPGAAVGYLERSLRADPHEYQTHYELALVYAALDQPERAAAHRERVREIQRDLTRLTELSGEAEQKPWDPEVRLRLAEVCERLGKRGLAARWREAAAACRVKSG